MKPDSDAAKGTIRWQRQFLAICFLFAVTIIALFKFPTRPRHPAIPPSGPVYIRILPGHNFSLVNHEMNVTNPATIKDIEAAVASAEKYFPNHPQSRWECYMIISDASGDSYYCLANTTEQGTIIYEETSVNGFIFSTHRSDSLGALVEGATAP